MIGRPPCSDQSRERNDPLFATASAGDRWLVVEVAGAWGPSAFLQSPSILDPAVGHAIVRRAGRAGVRLVAIRRPGRRRPEPRWRWFVADARPGHERLVGGEASGPQEYLDIPLDGSLGSPVTDPLVAVCAHGRHDQCCAVRGRPATAAIADAFPESTWECSHLGGDRFAATMLILPHGLYYGRVDEAPDPADLVRAYLDGRVQEEFLRGRCSVPQVVQAAQHFAREQYGDDRIVAYPPLKIVEDDDVTRVTLAGADGPIDVRLTETMSEPLLSMCVARIPGRVKQFGLVSVGGVVARR